MFAAPVGKNESVLLRDRGFRSDDVGGCERLKCDPIGVGILPAKLSSPGEFSLSGCRWCSKCGCVCVNGEGGEADPAMEICWSIFISTSSISGDANEAGELPLLLSVSSTASNSCGGAI